mmetsp:Transcript_28895/g.55083  ORF Transcript_28895/g.55083 Transcript_28895/m.55083 type:complete len:206 (-) Transcript_28895:1056-1673(-)
MRGPFRVILLAHVKAHVIAVPCHGDIGQMFIHRARRQHIGVIHRRALGFVDCDGVAVIEATIVVGIKTHLPWCVAVQRNRQASVIGLDHRSQHPVFDAKVFVVLAKDNPVPRSHGTRASVRVEQGFWRRIFIAECCADRLVQRVHVLAAMRKGQPCLRGIARCDIHHIPLGQRFNRCIGGRILAHIVSLGVGCHSLWNIPRSQVL